MSKQRIGYIGVGLMGHGAAKNMLQQGHPLTIMGHRNRVPVDDLVAFGAREAKTPAAVARVSDVVFLCLPSTVEVEHAIYGEYGAYTQGLRDNGSYVAGDALQPIAAATTVRVRDGEQLVTDGPFAETKEQLGGYYLIEAESLDDAIEHASKIPAARSGSIEVRPVVVYDEVPA